MAKRSSQTAPGKAVYRLTTDLRVPTSDDKGHFRWLAAGTEATADDLHGLVLPALEAGGFVEKVADAVYLCEACQAHGDADEKKKSYTLLELRDHYGKQHPGLAAPTE